MNLNQNEKANPGAKRAAVLALTFALALLPQVARANSTAPVLAAVSTAAQQDESVCRDTPRDCGPTSSVPDASATLTLLGCGIATLLAFKRRLPSRFTHV
ncbi:MAG TPA: VPDSG-CTERM sorting domain-containing protein [Candidatus Didemnitutus sp.]|nr:VPDSG-CTERM sorting domain-containing protein [Candidatus Didemnitutus sp.]